MSMWELKQVSQQPARAVKYENELIRKVRESPSRDGFLSPTEDRFSSVCDGLNIILCEGQ